MTLGTSTSTSTPAVWVTTVSHEGDAEFWDPSSGFRYKSHDVSNHGFRAVGCLFNHEGFWANVSPVESAKDLRFDVSESAIWKGMSHDAILSVKR